jgi:hypothetical protein
MDIIKLKMHIVSNVENKVFISNVWVWLYCYIFTRGPFAKFVDYGVGTLWRCGDGLVFDEPPLENHAVLTTLHPLLGNVLQTVDHFEISCIGALFSWMQKPRNRMGQDLNWILCSAWKKWRGGIPLEHPLYSPYLAPCDFLAFLTMKRELRGKKFRSDQRSAARFREVGRAL